MMPRQTCRLAGAALALCAMTYTAAARPEDCPGCTDETTIGSTTYSTSSPHISMFTLLTKFDGKCFVLPEGGACVMAYPCTPYIEVWASTSSAPASGAGGGSCDGIGLGMVDVTWWPGQSYVDKLFYRDDTEVSCGGDKDWYYKITWSGWFEIHPDETAFRTGQLECGPRDD